MERYRYLFSKYINNSCDKAELDEFINWVKSPENEQEFKKLIAEDWTSFKTDGDSLESTQKSFDKLLKKIELDKGDQPEIQVADHKLGKTKQLARQIIRIAASILLPIVLGTGSYYYLRSVELSKELALTSITAPHGSKSQIILSDGTTIWLNSGSTLEYPLAFTRKTREVKLSGEGYFDVARNPDKPFIVQTSDLRIKVLGTIFNVKSYPEEGTIETTLLEGSVAISGKNENSETKDVVYLKPNERATYIRSEGKIIQSQFSDSQKNSEHKAGSKLARKEQMILTKVSDTEQYTSWKDEKLTFRNENFENLCVKLERWYNVKITIHSEELKKYHYTGTLQNENIVDAIEAFKLTMPLRYKINRDEIEIWQTNKTN